MDPVALADRSDARRRLLESGAVFAASLALLLALAPTAPFTKELGVCEAGAVRDVLSGTIVLPHYTPGVPVQVPPMYWWAAALAVRIFGWNEIALRTPSIAACAITAALIYSWLSVSVNRRAAMWSVPVLLSAKYVADAAREPRMDALFMMFLAVAVVALERAVASNPKRMVLLAAAALAMGAAILTKGPLGVILPALTLAIYLAIERRLSELVSTEMILTFAAAVIIGAIWYSAALQIGGRAFFKYQIVHGLFRRFFGAAAGTIGECQNPFYYFLPKLVSDFLPWSFFYPALAVLLWRDRASLPPPITFGLCWFAAVLGFFTISAGKCLVYILPLFPALAALTGWLIAKIAERQRGADLARRLFDWASLAIAVGVVVIVVAVAPLVISGSGDALAPHLHRSDRRFLEVLMAATRRMFPALVLWVSLWILGATIALSSFVSRRIVSQSAAIALIAIAGTLFWYGSLNPALAREETLKTFASIVDPIVPAGVPIDYIGQRDCDFAFYSNHPVGERKNFQCGNEAADAYFLVWQDQLSKLTGAQRACLEMQTESRPIDSHGARALMLEKK